MEFIINDIVDVELKVQFVIYFCIFAWLVLLAVFLLSSRPEYITSAYNCYGVEKETKKDKWYKIWSVTLCIVSILSVLIWSGYSLATSWKAAKETYSYYQSEAVVEEAYNYLYKAAQTEGLGHVSEEANAILDNNRISASRLREVYELMLDAESNAQIKQSITGISNAQFGYGFYSNMENASEILDRIEWKVGDFQSYIWKEGELTVVLGLYLIFFGIGIIFPLYMYPLKVARRNAHTLTAAVGWLNFLFGWTIVVWIVMLIWANGASEKNPSASAPSGTKVNTAITDTLRELQSLKEAGILTEEEFAAKKAELLAKL